MPGPRRQFDTEPTLEPAATPGRRSVIYIAGYGRSGSTILDIALSSHREVIGLGEINQAFGVLSDPTATPHGFWAEVDRRRSGEGDSCEGDRPTSARDAHAAVRAIEGAVSGVVHRSGHGAIRRRYLDDQRQIIEAAFNQPGIRSLVDSSKSSRASAWRLHQLSTVVTNDDIDADLYCLILVRRLADVIRSVRSGRGDDGRPLSLPTLRAVFGWITANTIAASAGLTSCGRQRTRVLRYEQLCRDPAATLSNVHRWVGLPDNDDGVREGLANGFVPGEQIYGNRVRHSRSITIEQTAARSISGPVDILAAAIEWTVSTLLLRRLPSIDSTADARVHLARRA